MFIRTGADTKTDEEKAAVEADNTTEQTPAEPAAQADDGNNFGESAEDNFGGGFEDNFGLGDDALAAGTIPQAPSAVKKKPAVEPEDSIGLLGNRTLQPFNPYVYYINKVIIFTTLSS